MSGATLALAILAVLPGQPAVVHSRGEDTLREYSGTYQWAPDDFLYLQLWSELTAVNQLVAFDESGEVRVLYPTERDSFITGAAAAVKAPIESRIKFVRNSGGALIALNWQREGAPARVARRVDIEQRENIRFSNGDVTLAGTLISPQSDAKHPVIILVHASGAEDREYLLPFAHFLIRHGIAILGYDKRGVGGSTGDWRSASFDDLAGDVIAAFEYLKTRNDIDHTQIGLLGWSQAGWVMPLAAVRAKDIAFLISISGAGIPVAETTIDQTRNEMTARGMKAETVNQIVDLMKLQYHFAQTGEGWDEYSEARASLVARLGQAPETYPESRDDPYWAVIRRLYLYDPAATLHQLRVPTLAFFGELDNNIIAEKNRAAWEAALKASGSSDYTLRIVPRANHMMMEAKVGSNAEMPTLQRFAPSFSQTLQEWLATHVRGFRK